MGPDLDSAAQDIGFPSKLARLCASAEIFDCQQDDCKNLRVRMDTYAPPCNWKSFRDWVLAAMSCQHVMSRKGEQPEARAYIAHAAYSCFLLLTNYVDRKKGQYFVPHFGRHTTAEAGSPRAGDSPPDVDLAGVANLIYWAVKIQTEAGVDLPLGRWDRRLVPPHVIMTSIESAIGRLSKMALCKNRIWHLVNVSDRKEADLPDFISALEQVGKRSGRGSDNPFRHLGHEECTASKCRLSHINSTNVKQLHKCRSPRTDGPEFGGLRESSGHESSCKTRLIYPVGELESSRSWPRLDPPGPQSQPIASPGAPPPHR